MGKAVMKVTPAASTAAFIAKASSVRVAMGFSQSTCAPDRTASSTSSRWRAFSEVTITASGCSASRSSWVQNQRRP